jgi:hypothetical protein
MADVQNELIAENDKLRAEVERLRTNQNTVLAAELRAIKEAELRAEVERLKAANQVIRDGWETAFNIGVSEQEQNKQLRAEVERLRIDANALAQGWNAASAEVERLRAENARLQKWVQDAMTLFKTALEPKP